MLVLAVFLFAVNAAALGISPAIAEITFQPGLAQDGEIRVLGEPEPFTVKVMVDGELGQYITIDHDVVEVPLGGATIKYHISLPAELRPGRLRTTIALEQQAQPTAASGPGKATFGARAAVGHTIIVNVPVEGKYAEASLSASSVQLGQPTNFIVSLTNYGKETIDAAQGNIEVINQQNKPVASIPTDAASIPPGESRELAAHWTPQDLPLGPYRAVATIDYDGQTATAHTTFLIGDVSVEILSLEPSLLTSGLIQKLTLEVRSQWSEPLPGTYAAIALFKDGIEEGKEVDTLTTVPLLLEPWEKGILTAYWDTSIIKGGDYTAKATLFYGTGRTTTKEFSLLVQEPQDNVSLPLIGVGILGSMVLFSVLFVHFRRRSQQREEF